MMSNLAQTEPQTPQHADARSGTVADALGVVVIGRNEGERLRRCLGALAGCAASVVYVDSGSSDGSPALARSLGVDVVELDRSSPFTAARGRQAGLDHLLRIRPALEFIQFIDGDCTLAPGWLDAAAASLQSNPRAAAVCGRLREEHSERSLYSRIVDVQWDAPPVTATGDRSFAGAQEIGHFGGIAILRVEAITAAGGWPQDLIAGEEPDLSFRLRGRGWTILRLPRDMALHDIAMTRLSQYWRRAVRTGHAYAEVAARHASGPSRDAARPWTRHVLSISVYGLLLPLGIITCVAAALPVQRLRLPAAAGLLVIFFLYARMWASNVRFCLRHGRRFSFAVAYAAVETVGKFGQAAGLLKYWTGRLRRRRSGIIEYKRPEPRAT